MSTVKDEIRRLAERLPDTVTWDEVMSEVYVRLKIAACELNQPAASLRTRRHLRGMGIPAIPTVPPSQRVHS